MAVSADSPVFKPEQCLLDRLRAGFVARDQQAVVRARPALRLLLGGEGSRQPGEAVLHRGKRVRGQLCPAGYDGDAPFYNADKNNFSPRLSASYQLTDKTAIRGGFGLFYGPGQFEDRIQPMENYIDRSRLQAADVPNNGLQYPSAGEPEIHCCRFAATRTNVRTNTTSKYGASVSQELPGAFNLTVGYTGSRGKDMFIRGVANTLDFNTRARLQPTFGQIDYKTSGCARRAGDQQPTRSPAAATRATTRCRSALSRRFRGGLTGGMNYRCSRNKGTTQGSNEAATAQNTFDYESDYGTNPQDIPHTFNASLVYQIPGEGLLRGGWRVGGIVNGRSGVPLNVVISRPDNATVNGVTVTNIPGGNSRGTQRPDIVPGVNP